MQSIHCYYARYLIGHEFYAFRLPSNTCLTCPRYPCWRTCIALLRSEARVSSKDEEARPVARGECVCLLLVMSGLLSAATRGICCASGWHIILWGQRLGANACVHMPYICLGVVYKDVAVAPQHLVFESCRCSFRYQCAQDTEMPLGHLAESLASNPSPY